MASRKPEMTHQPLVHCETCGRDRPQFEYNILPGSQDMTHQWLFCIMKKEPWQRER